MVIKYIVKRVSIIDSKMTQWIFDDEQKAKTKIRELKDEASNSKLVSFYELKPESLISNFFIARFVRACIRALYSASDSSLFIAI